MKFADFERTSLPATGNVFVFAANEDFYFDESVTVWPRLLGQGWVVERMTVADFEEVPAQRLMDDALTPSLFAQSRAIAVSNPEKITKSRIEVLREIHALQPSSLKVILNGRPDSKRTRGKSTEAWFQGFPAFEIDDPDPPEVVRWLTSRFQLSPDVARYVVETTAADLQTLVTEVEKLKTYAGAADVTTTDVDVLLLRAEQYGPFELEDAVVTADVKRAMTVTSAMLADGSDHLRVLYSISKAWRQLFAAKCMAGGRLPREASAVLMIPDWKLGRVAATSRKLSWRVLTEGFTHLLAADRAFKSSAVNPQHYFDILLWKLFTPDTSAPTRRPV